MPRQIDAWNACDVPFAAQVGPTVQTSFGGSGDRWMHWQHVEVRGRRQDCFYTCGTTCLAPRQVSTTAEPGRLLLSCMLSCFSTLCGLNTNIPYNVIHLTKRFLSLSSLVLSLSPYLITHAYSVQKHALTLLASELPVLKNMLHHNPQLLFFLGK